MATSRTSPAASTTINLRRRGTLAIAATVVAATTLGVTATAYAKNGGEHKKDVRSTVACGSGSLRLKAKYDDGNRIEVEAEVDRNVAGEQWTLTLTDNGKAVWTGQRATAGPSGSFEVETTIAADGSGSTGTPSSSPTTTTSPTTSDDSSSTTTTSPATGDDSSSTTTASPTTTGEDNPGRSGDDHPKLRLSSKGGDKGGDDKGGQSKPGNGKHEIGVSATLGTTLSCATKVTL